MSMFCSTVWRCTRSCGPDTERSRSGREPPSSGTLSSSSSPKYRVPGSWCVFPGLRRVVHLVPSLSPPALAILCPRGAAWCVDSARAMATLRRSCRKNCLRRRSRRLLAVPASSAIRADHMDSTERLLVTDGNANLFEPGCCCCCCCGCF